jgi:hypothetical protein
MRYLTFAEFNDSINSFESLCSFIAEGFPVAGHQFQHDLHALLRRQTEIVLPVGPIALGMAGDLRTTRSITLILPVPITRSQIYLNPRARLTDNPLTGTPFLQGPQDGTA